MSTDTEYCCSKRTSLQKTRNGIPLATFGLEEGLADEVSILPPTYLHTPVKSALKLFLLHHSGDRGIPIERSVQPGNVKGKYRPVAEYIKCCM